MESSSAWQWGPAVLLRAQWFMCCWVRAAGSSQRSLGRIAAIYVCVCVCVCVRMCERESVYFSQPHAINLNVCICVRRCMRASPKFSAGCPSLFDLEWLHLFDCGHAWKAFGAVKIMTSSQRWSHLCMSCADWLTWDTEWGVLMAVKIMH